MYEQQELPLEPQETGADCPFGEVIHRYTREQAIEDGFLIDVTDTAREAGFVYPVAVTRAVWERYVTVPKGVSGQDEDGRLWDIVWMGWIAARRETADRSCLLYRLLVRNDNRRAQLVTLKAICGPGWSASPMIVCNAIAIIMRTTAGSTTCATGLLKPRC